MCIMDRFSRFVNIIFQSTGYRKKKRKKVNFKCLKTITILGGLNIKNRVKRTANRDPERNIMKIFKSNFLWYKNGIRGHRGVKIVRRWSKVRHGSAAERFCQNRSWWRSPWTRRRRRRRRRVCARRSSRRPWRRGRRRGWEAAGARPKNARAVFGDRIIDFSRAPINYAPRTPFSVPAHIIPRPLIR